MVNVAELPADTLIQQLATHLKEKEKEVTPPAWTVYTKTGSQSERVPNNADWWYVRCASLMRKLYLRGPIGVSRLSTAYGGARQRGMAPSKARRGGSIILRKAMLQLQKAGLVAKAEGGKALTAKGRSLMDRLALTAARELVKAEPPLKRYFE